MTRHLQREIDNLKKKVLSLSALVEDRLHRAVLSLADRNGRLADEIYKTDWKVDEIEVEVEEDCLKILALHQPVAIDLRFIIAVLKINNDLERVGDMAASIARQVSHLAGHLPIDIQFDFSKMAGIAQSMLKLSIDSLVEMDPVLAAKVCAKDDEIDELHRQMYHTAEQAMRRYPDRIDDIMHLVVISRHLERVADHATNIAEDVVYMVDGVITRHRMEEYVSEELKNESQ